ncbi:MAG TPA: NAD-dependent malic enzyme, partial [Steroidobacteraceae bacterium]
MTKAIQADSAMEIDVEGYALINTPLLNKGTAFTEIERDTFHLHGLLPPHIGELEEQATRRLNVLKTFTADIQRYVFLRDLQDTNETLFYSVLTSNLEKMLPLVYTPTVGEGCQRFSEIWRKPRGIFLSYPNKHRIREILAAPRFDNVRIIVVSDGERILGLGDQGAGGMGIPIGKLSLYTGCAGIHPDTTLPILLDLGTNNQERISDPLYIGWRHERIRGAEYDAFVEEFVTAVTERWPHVLLQWEDFAQAKAHRLLTRYRDRLCTFNDDIQGTAAVAAATLLAAINVSGVSLNQQRIVIHGAGSAGCGIAALLHQAMVDSGLKASEAKRRFFVLNSKGLLVEGMPDITPAQAPFLQPRETIAAWTLRKPGAIELFDVVANAQPTALIGVSGQPGAFTESIVREMARRVARPVILPLSNPLSRSEASPEQLLNWTEGRALIGTGSPYSPVKYGEREYVAAQTNNSYIFPGVGLGVITSGARQVTDGMFMAAALALADLSPTKRNANAPLLPAVRDLREVAARVARNVADQAQKEGVADRVDAAALDARIKATMWSPQYQPFRRNNGRMA